MRLRRTRMHPVMRDMVRETSLDIADFMYPLFVIDEQNVKNPIASMPDVYQMSIEYLLEECRELVELGIYSVLLFGIPAYKDAKGSSALDNSIVARATHAIKTRFPQMFVAVDLCFCEYTDHGHCGILDGGSVDNDATLEILGLQALHLAQSGADLIAPSGMMDKMIAHLRKVLDESGFYNLPIMSYSTKFASAYYGPFRDVAQSTPSFGDRKTYQEDGANRREALRESLNDEKEGADILMVKPALAYLDIVRDIREASLLPLAVYNVSGEYSMLKYAGKAGVIDYERVLLETMISFKRAGADIIISYHSKEMAHILKTR
ncbi:delta-aminolevulinic acid dehydratase [Helicobacter enhydrae]|uniref:Delta-aminolevulinic acid dehydratase n=1 Tax=Helicobacter enhydrae TaxID=222136 RepID=A0A1B1U4M7_9HELI|nr:porphobilinogen synthase [Helicobacter enhydrae]ANV97723.1 delta-aminolevulinic acid dehydratase [Helicobacter enhydrae]